MLTTMKQGIAKKRNFRPKQRYNAKERLGADFFAWHLSNSNCHTLDQKLENKNKETIRMAALDGNKVYNFRIIHIKYMIDISNLLAIMRLSSYLITYQACQLMSAFDLALLNRTSHSVLDAF